MTKIVALMNEKGGVGKSTLATNLAAGLARAGHTVVIVDADPQGTARDWMAKRPEGMDLPDVVALDRPEMITSIRHLTADYIIIDTPARASSTAARVVSLADLVLVPLQPSGPDLDASAATVKMVHDKRDLGGRIDAALVLTRFKGATSLSKEARAGEWNQYGLPLLQSVISDRVSYAQAMTDGVSIYEIGGPGQAEVDLLIQEIGDLL